MKTYIVFLRGINVGGHKKMKMETLRVHLKKIGYDNVLTYIQSGNIIIKTKENLDVVTSKVEDMIYRDFGFKVPVIGIEKEALIKIFETCPYSEIEKDINISRVYFTLLYNRVPEGKFEALKSLVKEGERYEVNENVIYMYCPKGYHTSKMGTNHLEKKLEVITTTRGYKTIKKLLILE